MDARSEFRYISGGKKLKEKKKSAIRHALSSTIDLNKTPPQNYQKNHEPEKSLQNSILSPNPNGPTQNNSERSLKLYLTKADSCDYDTNHSTNSHKKLKFVWDRALSIFSKNSQTVYRAPRNFSDSQHFGGTELRRKNSKNLDLLPSRSQSVTQLCAQNNNFNANSNSESHCLGPFEPNENNCTKESTNKCGSFDLIKINKRGTSSSGGRNCEKNEIEQLHSEESVQLMRKRREKIPSSVSPDSSFYQEDSGLDTWKSPGSQSSNSPSHSIVCTISQKIPKNYKNHFEDVGKKSLSLERDFPFHELSNSIKNRNSLHLEEENSNKVFSFSQYFENLGATNGDNFNSKNHNKIQHKPSLRATQSEQVNSFKISEKLQENNESDKNLDEANMPKYHSNKSVVLLNSSTTNSEDEVECMSEIDLNSDSDIDSSKLSYENIEPFKINQSSVSTALYENISANDPIKSSSKTELLKMKFLSNPGPFPPEFHLSCGKNNGGRSSVNENELDSLDLTLFEHRECRCEENHFYDSILLGSGIYERGSETGTCCGNKNWSDAGSEFEFMAPAQFQNQQNNREIQLNRTEGAECDPYFCVLNQLDKNFTTYRNEEMSFGGDGISPTDILRIGVVGNSHNSLNNCKNTTYTKCAAKLSMNPVKEEEEEENMFSTIESNSSSGQRANKNYYRNSSPALATCKITVHDESNGNDRRGSAPLTPILGGSRERDATSRLANFFSKRSFKSNPLKRTKSNSKIEKKALNTENERSESSSSPYPTRLRNHDPDQVPVFNCTKTSFTNFLAREIMSLADLSKNDLKVRPLHSSLLKNEYGFQLNFESQPSKYFSCLNLKERDAIVDRIKRVVKPYGDELRRVENSLKIWILEAKGVPGSGKAKKYFCEIYIDETLYGRTFGKINGTMLFWGEHFELNSLPNEVKEITVVVFREGERKRKKERSSCIGRVKIPISSLNTRNLVEKWYPIEQQTETTNSSLKDKGKEREKDTKLTLRVKCKYESVDILPLRCYKPFIQYLREESGSICESLESVLSVKSKDELANALVHALHHEGLAKELIAKLALCEISKSDDVSLIFRSNSIASKAMESFLKLTGLDYLHNTLSSFIEHFQNSEELVDYEVDPTKLNSSTSLAKNQGNLRTAINTVWKTILHSASSFPNELRECFAHCRQILKEANREGSGDHLISASVFLRFLCPAILSPSLFDISKEYPSEKSARNLTLLAKILQTLANFTKFQGKETYMEFLNDFIESEAANMKEFLANISSQSEVNLRNKNYCIRGAFIDIGKYASILSTLLNESVEKLQPDLKNEKIRKLESLLLNIKFWLSQPHNSPNFPPPSIPPPPPPTLHHEYQVPMVQNPHSAQKTIIKSTIPPTSLPLHLQIPTQMPVLQQATLRSGSVASSGYQSQSPVLEETKNEKKSECLDGEICAMEIKAPLSFSNPAFALTSNYKNGSTPSSQSVEDLTQGGRSHVKRISRSSSSSDCEYAPSSVSSIFNGNVKQKLRSKQSSSYHNRLSRRSSAELLRKSHSYSSSTDNDSDSGHAKGDEDGAHIPFIPPRRVNSKKFSTQSANNGEKNLEKYGSEMIELRRAMEALQLKLNRAEERLFGHENSPSQKQQSHLSNNELVGEGSSANNGPLLEQIEMDNLLEKFLSAEEEMKREHKLLTALDKKQKLIEEQELKISRLDAVNNQLLSALSQIRDSLQQQHVQQHQLKIEKQLLKQQEHLASLSQSLPQNSHHIPKEVPKDIYGLPVDSLIYKNEPKRPARLLPSPRHSLALKNKFYDKNTSRILVNSSSDGHMSPDSLENGSNGEGGSKRDSSAILGEEALKMLAELKSSSC